MFKSNVAWFDRLHRDGTLAAWLESGDERRIDVGLHTLWFPLVPQPRSAEVAALLRPFRGQGEAWDQRLRAFFNTGDIHHSPDMQRLFLDLLDDGLFDGGRRSWWHLLDEGAERAAAFVTDVVVSWLDRRIAAVETSSEQDDTHPGLIDDIRRIIQPASHRDSTRFARLVFPRVVQLVERTADPGGGGWDSTWPWRSAPSGLRPHDAILNGLIHAMRGMAAEDPEAVDALTAGYAGTMHQTIAFVLFQIWGANSQHFAEA